MRCPKCKYPAPKIRVLDNFIDYAAIEIKCPKCTYEKIKYVFKDQ